MTASAYSPPSGPSSGLPWVFPLESPYDDVPTHGPRILGVLRLSHVPHMGVQAMSLIVTKGTALAVRQGRLRRRKRPPKGIIIHTTGAGPWVRWSRGLDDYTSPYDAACYIYERISPYSGHYLVDGDSGAVTRLVEPDYVAWHTGSKGSWRYKLPTWARGKGFGWFATRFPDIKSPRGLLGGSLWREGSANELCIGIEVSPPKSGPRDAWSPKAWESLRKLINHFAGVYGIPLDRYHIITHSDAHPFARTTKRGSPWDPAPKQWMIGDATERLKISPSKYMKPLVKRA